MENRNPINARLRTDSYSDIVPAERAGRWIKGQREIYERQAQAKRVLRDLVVQLSVIGRDESHRSLKQWKQSLNGGVAQLGEHLPCKQGVKGSIPFISTSRQCRLPKPGVRSEKPTVKAEAEKRGKGKETDGRIRA